MTFCTGITRTVVARASLDAVRSGRIQDATRTYSSELSREAGSFRTEMRENLQQSVGRNVYFAAPKKGGKPGARVSRRSTLHYPIYTSMQVRTPASTLNGTSK